MTPQTNTHNYTDLIKSTPTPQTTKPLLTNHHNQSDQIFFLRKSIRSPLRGFGSWTSNRLAKASRPDQAGCPPKKVLKENTWKAIRTQFQNHLKAIIQKPKENPPEKSENIKENSKNSSGHPYV